MKKNQLDLGLVVLAALVALVIWGRDRIHFDFGAFRSQLALADWRKIGIGAGCIYLAYVFRSVRWALLLRHNKKVPPVFAAGNAGDRLYRGGSDRPRCRPGSALPGCKEDRAAAQLADCRVHR